MTTTSFTSLRQIRAAWPVMSLALFAALGYLLIGLNVLTIGDLNMAEAPSVVVYFAALCYVIAGLVILPRSRPLLVSGVFINTLMMLFFHGLHPGQPVASYFSGAVATAVAQMLLEGFLICIVLADWLRLARREL